MNGGRASGEHRESIGRTAAGQRQNHRWEQHGERCAPDREETVGLAGHIAAICHLGGEGGCKWDIETSSDPDGTRLAPLTTEEGFSCAAQALPTNAMHTVLKRAASVEHGGDAHHMRARPGTSTRAARARTENMFAWREPRFTVNGGGT